MYAECDFSLFYDVVMYKSPLMFDSKHTEHSNVIRFYKTQMIMFLLKHNADVQKTEITNSVYGTMTLHFIIFFICAYTEKIAYGNKKNPFISFLPCSRFYFPS